MLRVAMTNDTDGIVALHTHDDCEQQAMMARLRCALS